MILTGLLLGIQALKDIRASEGKLGGAVLASIGAGTVPGILIVALTSGAFLLVGEELVRGSGRRPGEKWPVIGAFTGVGLAVLMFRKLHRFATGWMPSTGQTTPARRNTACCTSAIICTVAGSGLALLSMVLTYKTVRRSEWPEIYGFSALFVLMMGAILGILARNEPAGRNSAYVSGFLFVALLLLMFA